MTHCRFRRQNSSSTSNMNAQGHLLSCSCNFFLYLFLAFLLILPDVSGSSRRAFQIFWNSSNPMFQVDNTDHVFAVRLWDSVSILCPLYNDTVVEAETEQSVIYRVTKENYDFCRVEPGAIPVGQCKSPYDRSIIKIVVRDFSPSPNAMEFTAGKSYYFISTSKGDDSGIESKVGGLCAEKNMKFKFEIEPSPGYPQSGFNKDTDRSTDAPSVDEMTISPRWRGLGLRKTSTTRILPQKNKIQSSVDAETATFEEFWEKIPNAIDEKVGQEIDQREEDEVIEWKIPEHMNWKELLEEKKRKEEAERLNTRNNHIHTYEIRGPDSRFNSIQFPMADEGEDKGEEEKQSQQEMFYIINEGSTAYGEEYLRSTASSSQESFAFSYISSSIVFLIILRYWTRFFNPK